ncbi:hypothetical protein EVAR_73314_1 [Eumeta japonica]|uniref:Uncharacterized protein n=1 Tax=Eumeta variegata TaxID=151549 RepID=A0A4C1TLT3_EUMVA|nr:hypothetical protein EVAR_73314_1 [Eumeta japonica]
MVKSVPRAWRSQFGFKENTLSTVVEVLSPTNSLFYEIPGRVIAGKLNAHFYTSETLVGSATSLECSNEETELARNPYL